MQDNEPLMRALSNLITVNSPDLVLFVGEALVGNDAVDQLTKFNQRLSDLATDAASAHTIDGILLTKFDTIDDKVRAEPTHCPCALQGSLGSVSELCRFGLLVCCVRLYPAWGLVQTPPVSPIEQVKRRQCWLFRQSLDKGGIWNVYAWIEECGRQHTPQCVG